MRTHPVNIQESALSHGRTRIEDAGPADGDPVLFVPGMTYPFEVATPLLAALQEAGHRCIRYDLYGRGGSSHDGTPLTLDVLVEQIMEVLDTVEVTGPIHVVSLSNSDLLTARLARHHPDRVASLTWLAPTGFDPRNMNGWTRTWTRMPLIQGLLRQRLRAGAQRRMAAHRAEISLADQARLGPIYDASIQSVADNPDFAAALISHLGHLPRSDEVRADLAAVAASEVPVLAVCFGQETDASDAGTTAFLGAVPQCRRVDIPEGHHMGLLDQAETIAGVMLPLCR